MNPQEASSSGESGASIGPACFSAGSDSPVSTASSHSRPSASSRRRSAGTTSPTPMRTTSPGTSSVTSTGLAWPSRSSQRGVAELGVQRLDRPLGAVLVEEAQPDAQADDRQDDRSVGAFADEERGQCRGDQEDQQRIAQLAHQHRERPGAVASQRVRPCFLQAAVRLLAGEPGGVAVEALEHLPWRQCRRLAQGYGAPILPLIRWRVDARPCLQGSCHGSTGSHRLARHRHGRRLARAGGGLARGRAPVRSQTNRRGTARLSGQSAQMARFGAEMRVFASFDREK